jgi:hypothetical protein
VLHGRKSASLLPEPLFGSLLFVSILGAAACFEAVGETTAAASNGGTGRGATGASNGGTASTGGTGPWDGGCSLSPALAADELRLCDGGDGCGCPLQCVYEPAYGFSVCEQPCHSLSDCPSLSTSCVDGGFCGPIPCGPAFGSFLDEVCDFTAIGDGNCLPPQTSWGWPASAARQGTCTQAGELGEDACIEGVTRSAGALADCLPGTICAGSCLPLCDPDDPMTCTDSYDVGVRCMTFDPDRALAGVCVFSADAGAVCGEVGWPCQVDTACCSEYCAAGSCQFCTSLSCCSTAGLQCEISSRVVERS